MNNENNNSEIQEIQEVDMLPAGESGPTPEEDLQWFKEKAKTLCKALAAAERELEAIEDDAEKLVRKAAITSIQEDLGRIHTNIKLHQEDQAPPALETKAVSKMPKEKTAGDLLKDESTLLKFADHMTKLTDKMKADKFWLKFQQSVKKYKFDPRQSASLLEVLIQDHHKGPSWFSSMVYPVLETITFEDLKEKFYSHFLDEDWRSQRVSELFDIKFRKGERVRDFTHRFSETMQTSEFNWFDDSPHTSFIRHLLYYRCPPSVQNHCKGKPDDYATCDEIAKALNSFNGRPTDVRASTGCDRCQDCKACNSKTSTPGGGGKKDIVSRLGSRPTEFCEQHGECSHPTNKCRDLIKKRKAAQEKSKRARDEDTKDTEDKSKKLRKDGGKSNMCWNEGCDKEHSFAHSKVCEFKKKRDPLMRRIEVEEPEEEPVPEPEQGYNSCDEITFGQTVLENSANKFLYCPALIHGVTVKAGIDSMASSSLMAVSFAKELKLKVHPVKGKLRLGVQGSSSPRIGVTDPIEVRVKDLRVMHAFEVADLHQDSRCVFGIDILPKVGISINGIPVDYPKKVEVSPVKQIEVKEMDPSLMSPSMTCSTLVT